MGACMRFTCASWLLCSTPPGHSPAAKLVRQQAALRCAGVAVDLAAQAAVVAQPQQRFERQRTCAAMAGVAVRQPGGRVQLEEVAAGRTAATGRSAELLRKQRVGRAGARYPAYVALVVR